MASFFTELKRRKVFKVGLAYLVLAWLLIQVVVAIESPLHLPEWVDTLTIILLIIGFPVALLFAWAFELTPEGIKPTHHQGQDENIEQTTSRKLNFIVIAGLVLVILFMVFDNYFLTSTEILEDEQIASDLNSLDNQGIGIETFVPGFSNRAAIAVLPLVNMSNDSEQEYFADGITEDLITGLQSLQIFPVIARTSTFRYKGSSPDIREVAIALGAGYVIEGSVRKVGDDVRVNIQLNNNQAQQVWANVYDYKFDDVLQLQSELVVRIIQAIEPELLISEADRARYVRTEEMEAFDYFLRATSHTNASYAFTDLNGQVVTIERLELAREYALRAVEIDPNFAAGWRILNHIQGGYLLQYSYLYSEEELQEILKLGIEYGEHSRQLSPFEPTVCACLAGMLLMSGDIEGARLLQEESLKQNPSSAISHAVLAKILQVSGEPERALEEITLAKRLSPQDMAMTTFLYFEAAILQDLGRFDEAVEVAKRSILLSSFNFDSEFVKVTSLLASGLHELATTAVEQLAINSPENFVPTSGWGATQPFPVSVADNVQLASGHSLHGLNYNEGLRLVFEDLGWDFQVQVD